MKTINSKSWVADQCRTAWVEKDPRSAVAMRGHRDGRESTRVFASRIAGLTLPHQKTRPWTGARAGHSRPIVEQPDIAIWKVRNSVISSMQCRTVVRGINPDQSLQVPGAVGSRWHADGTILDASGRVGIIICSGTRIRRRCMHGRRSAAHCQDYRRPRPSTLLRLESGWQPDARALHCKDKESRTTEV